MKVKEEFDKLEKVMKVILIVTRGRIVIRKGYRRSNLGKRAE